VSIHLPGALLSAPNDGLMSPGYPSRWAAAQHLARLWLPVPTASTDSYGWYLRYGLRIPNLRARIALLEVALAACLIIPQLTVIASFSTSRASCGACSQKCKTSQ